MHSESFGLEPSDRSVRAHVFVREEPDEDEDEQHEDDAKRMIAAMATRSGRLPGIVA
jgi:hypothetical protein